MKSAANVSQQLSRAKKAAKAKIKPAKPTSSQDLLTDPLTDLLTQMVFQITV
jgi:hypothetical protein